MTDLGVDKNIGLSMTTRSSGNVVHVPEAAAAGKNQPVLDISNLVQRIGGRIVLRLERWSVPRGRHSLILGTSGSGKTTLLHLISGLLQPSEGRILLDGQEITNLSSRERDDLRRRRLGIVLQNLHLISALSIRDNLRLAQSLGGSSPAPERIDELLNQLGVLRLAGRKPDMVSQGERQRVAIARAVVNRPRLLLADEPTSSVDDENAGRVMSLLMQQAEMSDATLIVATHDKRIKPHFDSHLTLEARP